MKKYKKALHIFRRDLRLADNTALNFALENSEKVIPCFILDERQLKDNPYRSDNALQFMINSLKELHLDLKNKGYHLYLFKGISENIIKQLLGSGDIDLITVNRDYTPFAVNRDNKTAEICKKSDTDLISFSDALLTEPENVLKKDGKPYTVFSFFHKKAKLITPPLPEYLSEKNYFNGKLNIDNDIRFLDNIETDHSPKMKLKGGRKEGLRLLRKIGTLENYGTERDIPALDKTTRLSAHNKFGTVSIREIYKKVSELFGSEHTILTELYWRDFFTHIAYRFPKVFGNPFYDKYADIVWENDANKFNAWCEGMTGFPVVDAGMRELNSTGYMHNRVRMITASFFVKDLHIDWRKGERYFASKLTDYDPAVNNGNWQWAASTGCDAQPYFRIFNPWTQQKKFDKECEYIKKYVPELNDISPLIINDPVKLKKEKPADYPGQIIDHKEASQTAKRIYSESAERYGK